MIDGLEQKSWEQGLYKIKYTKEIHRQPDLDRIIIVIESHKGIRIDPDKEAEVIGATLSIFDKE